MKKKATPTTALAAPQATSTALAIPASITPKPTKRDLLEAMVERARTKHNTERNKLIEAKENYQKKIEAAAQAEFNRSTPTPSYTLVDFSSHKRVVITFTVTNPSLTKMLETYQKMPTLKTFDADAVRREIRKAMEAQKPSAVDALLTNPDSLKAIDASLAHLGVKTA